jgi:hypothetical protein
MCAFAPAVLRYRSLRKAMGKYGFPFYISKPTMKRGYLPSLLLRTLATLSSQVSKPAMKRELFSVWQL